MDMYWNETSGRTEADFNAELDDMDREPQEYDDEAFDRERDRRLEDAAYRKSK